MGNLQKIEAMLDDAGKVRIYGADKQKLIDWFRAKGHKNIVLRVVDVVELRNDYQDLIVSLVDGGPANTEDGWRKRRLLHYARDGYVTLPITETLTPLSFERLQKLQAALMDYVRIRQEKGEPCRIDPCEKCGGAGGKCDECDGGGQTYTFVEMSDDEKRLSVGA